MARRFCAKNAQEWIDAEPITRETPEMRGLRSHHAIMHDTIKSIADCSNHTLLPQSFFLRLDSVRVLL
jgi:hypothetical protein